MYTSIPPVKTNAIALLLIVSAFLSSCNSSQHADSATIEKQLQEKLINAKEGDVIEIPEGTFTMSRSLVLDKVKNITIRGKGMDKSILNFKGQKDGAEGMRVTADGIVLEDFAILDPKGDCIKVQDATNVTFSRMKVGWTSLHDKKNGSYGTYPVGCTNVLIQDCEVFGSSDAGVYVGQSKNIIVRRNNVHDNVAGIEIENSIDADVYENKSENNTGGILVFDNPELPVHNGSRCRVYNNKVLNNNTRNFGQKGTTVAEIPAGTGVIVMATNQCEIYNNEIKNQNTVSVSVISYLSLQKPFKDTIFDPYCGGISIHDNNIAKGPGTTDGSTTFGALFAGLFGDKVPDIVYDGMVSPAYKNNDGSIKEDQKICIRNNGKASFVNLDLEHNSKNMNTDAKPLDCTTPPLNEVKLNL